MLNIGAYKSGGNSECDQAIAAMEGIRRFLKQGLEERSEWSATQEAMQSWRPAAVGAGR